MSGTKGKSGGFRKNAKRPLKYICELKQTSMRLPKDHIPVIKKRIKDEILVDYLVKKKKDG